MGQANDKKGAGDTAGIGTALASLNLLCGRHYINRAGQWVCCTECFERRWGNALKEDGCSPSALP